MKSNFKKISYLIQLGSVSEETKGLKGCNRDGFWAYTPYQC